MELNELTIALLLFAAGALASFINMMAGGGSMITIGIMILLGIDPAVANGTNRIGVLVGTASGAAAFKKEKISDLKTSLILGACAIPGAIIGSIYSVSISGELFQKLLALVMIFVLITLFLPKKKITTESTKNKKNFWIYPAMFVVGLYGGFIQVGVGYLLMAALRHLMAYDLVHVNMHKAFVVLIYTVPVLAVFGFSGNIHWWYAIILSAGNAVGSWFSVKLAVRKGDRVIKIVLVVAILLMVMKFLFV